MAYKPWDELKPSYRERLIKKGITPKMHALARTTRRLAPERRQTLKAARGHGIHTPSAIRDAEAAEKKRHQSPTYKRLIAQGKALKIKRNTVIRFADRHGVKLTKLLLDYKEYRNNIYVRNKSKGTNVPDILFIKDWAIAEGYQWDDEYLVDINGMDWKKSPFIHYH